MATKEEQEIEITEAVYRAMMRAIGMAIPVDAPSGLGGGMVVFTAGGMVAVEFLAQHFFKKSGLRADRQMGGGRQGRRPRASVKGSAIYKTAR